MGERFEVKEGELHTELRGCGSYGLFGALPKGLGLNGRALGGKVEMDLFKEKLKWWVGEA